MNDYPSNITREQFAIIRADLENAKKTTKPRTVDLYVLRGGIQWRMMPADFPKWQLCYYYFRVWADKGKDGNSESILEKVLKKL